MKKYFVLLVMCLITFAMNVQKITAEEATATEETKHKAELDAYVDLGLPSGTLWKDKNEEGGFYTYEQAMADFGSGLPTKEQFEELKSSCQWTWMGNGYDVVGPNGNKVFFPAAGCRGCFGSVLLVGSYCYYWSSTPDGPDEAWNLYFGSSRVYIGSTNRCYGLSVRLVR